MFMAILHTLKLNGYHIYISGQLHPQKEAGVKNVIFHTHDLCFAQT